MKKNGRSDVWQCWRQTQTNLERYRQQLDQVKLDRIANALRRFDLVARWVAEIRTDGRLLEIGCGGGELCQSPNFPSGIQYVGLDPLAVDGLKYDFPFVIAVAEKLPFLPKSFDCVLIKDSIDCFPEPKVAFINIARALSSNGVLLITESGHRDLGLFSYLKAMFKHFCNSIKSCGKRDLSRLLLNKLPLKSGTINSNARLLTPIDTYPVSNMTVNEILEIMSETAQYSIIESRIVEGTLFLVARART
jgi:ubiquinone/menaquinone biosynthesis C-methylase UbiE